MQPKDFQLNKILIIQTAFIGDVILATALIELLHQQFPTTKIDFLLRKGNESLLKNHPILNQVLIWDKKQNKYGNLLGQLQTIRKNQYDAVFNLQRFFSSGMLTALSKAKFRVGFDKNPLSALFTHKAKHQFGDHTHEVTRILELVKPFVSNLKPAKPKLYPSTEDYQAVKQYQQQPYVCIAPTSVWFTKQHAAEKWVELIDELTNTTIYLLGANSDQTACENIRKQCISTNVFNLSGKLTLLQSAALIEGAITSYVNDSAPLHLASAMNASVTAVFCSTISAFGFTPLSDQSRVVETQKQLSCRPCGIHGKKHCKIGTFECSKSIEVSELLKGFK